MSSNLWTRLASIRLCILGWPTNKMYVYVLEHKICFEYSHLLAWEGAGHAAVFGIQCRRDIVK